MKKTRRSNREFFNDHALIVAFRSAKVALGRSHREFFNDRAFGDRLVLDRLKVKIDRLADVPPGFVQSIPFGNATRKRRYVRGVTAFIRWFVHDFEPHVRSRLDQAPVQLASMRLRSRSFNEAAVQIATQFPLRLTTPAILQLCEKLIERYLGLLQNVTERRAFHRHVGWNCDFDGPPRHIPLKSNVRSALANHREPEAAQRCHDSIVVFGRDFRHRGSPSGRRSQSSKQSTRDGRLQQWGHGAGPWNGCGTSATCSQRKRFNEARARGPWTIIEPEVILIETKPGVNLCFVC